MEIILGIVIVGIVVSPILFFAGRSPMPDVFAHANGECPGAPCDCSIPCDCVQNQDGTITLCNRHWADQKYGFTD